jgi:hypothetical protein
VVVARWWWQRWWRGRERPSTTGGSERDSERKAVGLSRPLVTSQWMKKQHTADRDGEERVQRAADGGRQTADGGVGDGDGAQRSTEGRVGKRSSGRRTQCG